MRPLHGILPTLILSLPLQLQAQLVPKEAPAPHATGKAAPHARAKVKGLPDYAITSRSLWAEKRTGEKDDLTFRFASFQKRELSDHGMPVYDVYGKDPYSENGGKVPLGQLRLGDTGPEFSRHVGGPWTQGEKDGNTWVFALDQVSIRVDPMDESFTPDAFKAFAFERGVDVKTGSCVLESQRIAPAFHSAVLALATGRNEFKGSIKYPGSKFVMSVHGFRFRGHWVGRSTAPIPFSTTVGSSKKSIKEGGAEAPGSGSWVQFDMDESRLLLGIGPNINYALDGDPAGRLQTACAFDLNKGKPMADLADRYRGNWTRATWALGDEDDSFSREAEKGYCSLGMKVWVWNPLPSSWQHAAAVYVDQVTSRVKAAGGSVGLLSQTGDPFPGPVAFQSAPSSIAPGLPARSTSSPSMPAFPLAAFGEPGHMVSVHMSGEVRFWSADMSSFETKQELARGERLTSGAPAPDGKGFVTTGNSGVRQWDVAAARTVRILPMDGCQGYWCASYSPDGRTIAGGGNDGRTRLWDAQTGRLIGTTPKSSGWGITFGDQPGSGQRQEFVGSLAFSPDGKRLAEGMASGDVRIWDLSDPSTPKKVKVVTPEKGFGKVFRLQFLHGGSELVALNQTGSFQVFDCQSWRVGRKTEAVLPPASSALFSPAGDWVVTACEGGRVVRTNLASGAIDADRQVPGVAIGALALASGHVFLLTDQAWKSIEL